MSERSYTLPAIRVTAEERDAIKREAESRGLSLSEWVRRVATGTGNQPSAVRRAERRAAQRHAEEAQGSGAEPQPSPPERPAQFKCPISGCDYRPGSPAARCPRHARLVVPS